MADLERVYEFAFKATNPVPGYLKPEPHIICGPFSLGKTPDNTPARAARGCRNLWLPFRPRAAENCSPT